MEPNDQGNPPIQNNRRTQNRAQPRPRTVRRLEPRTQFTQRGGDGERAHHPAASMQAAVPHDPTMHPRLGTPHLNPHLAIGDRAQMNPPVYPPQQLLQMHNSHVPFMTSAVRNNSTSYATGPQAALDAMPGQTNGFSIPMNLPLHHMINYSSPSLIEALLRQTIQPPFQTNSLPQPYDFLRQQAAAVANSSDSSSFNIPQPLFMAGGHVNRLPVHYLNPVQAILNQRDYNSVGLNPQVSSSSAPNNFQAADHKKCRDNATNVGRMNNRDVEECSSGARHEPVPSTVQEEKRTGTRTAPQTQPDVNVTRTMLPDVARTYVHSQPNKNYTGVNTGKSRLEQDCLSREQPSHLQNATLYHTSEINTLARGTVPLKTCLPNPSTAISHMPRHPSFTDQDSLAAETTVYYPKTYFKPRDNEHSSAYRPSDYSAALRRAHNIEMQLTEQTIWAHPSMHNNHALCTDPRGSHLEAGSKNLTTGINEGPLTCSSSKLNEKLPPLNLPILPTKNTEGMAIKNPNLNAPVPLCIQNTNVGLPTTTNQHGVTSSQFITPPVGVGPSYSTHGATCMPTETLHTSIWNASKQSTAAVNKEALLKSYTIDYQHFKGMETQPQLLTSMVNGREESHPYGRYTIKEAQLHPSQSVPPNREMPQQLLAAAETRHLGPQHCLPAHSMARSKLTGEEVCRDDNNTVSAIIEAGQEHNGTSHYKQVLKSDSETLHNKYSDAFGFNRPQDPVTKNKNRIPAWPSECYQFDKVPVNNQTTRKGDESDVHMELKNNRNRLAFPRGCDEGTGNLLTSKRLQEAKMRDETAASAVVNLDEKNQESLYRVNHASHNRHGFAHDSGHLIKQTVDRDPHLDLPQLPGEGTYPTSDSGGTKDSLSHQGQRDILSHPQTGQHMESISQGSDLHHSFTGHPSASTVGIDLDTSSTAATQEEISHEKAKSPYSAGKNDAILKDHQNPQESTTRDENPIAPGRQPTPELTYLFAKSQGSRSIDTSRDQPVSAADPSDQRIEEAPSLDSASCANRLAPSSSLYVDTQLENVVPTRLNRSSDRTEKLETNLDTTAADKNPNLSNISPENFHKLLAEIYSQIESQDKSVVGTPSSEKSPGHRRKRRKVESESESLDSTHQSGQSHGRVNVSLPAHMVQLIRQFRGERSYKTSKSSDFSIPEVPLGSKTSQKSSVESTPTNENRIESNYSLDQAGENNEPIDSKIDSALSFVGAYDEVQPSSVRCKTPERGTHSRDKQLIAVSPLQDKCTHTDDNFVAMNGISPNSVGSGNRRQIDAGELGRSSNVKENLALDLSTGTALIGDRCDVVKKHQQEDRETPFLRDISEGITRTGDRNVFDADFLRRSSCTKTNGLSDEILALDLTTGATLNENKKHHQKGAEVSTLHSQSVGSSRTEHGAKDCDKKASPRDIYDPDFLRRFFGTKNNEQIDEMASPEEITVYAIPRDYKAKCSRTLYGESVADTMEDSSDGKRDLSPAKLPDLDSFKSMSSSTSEPESSSDPDIETLHIRDQAVDENTISTKTTWEVDETSKLRAPQKSEGMEIGEEFNNQAFRLIPDVDKLTHSRFSSHDQQNRNVQISDDPSWRKSVFSPPPPQQKAEYKVCKRQDNQYGSETSTHHGYNKEMEKDTRSREDMTCLESTNKTSSQPSITSGLIQKPSPDNCVSNTKGKVNSSIRISHCTAMFEIDRIGHADSFGQKCRLNHERSVTQTKINDTDIIDPFDQNVSAVCAVKKRISKDKSSNFQDKKIERNVLSRSESEEKQSGDNPSDSENLTEEQILDLITSLLKPLEKECQERIASRLNKPQITSCPQLLDKEDNSEARGIATNYVKRNSHQENHSHGGLCQPTDNSVEDPTILSPTPVGNRFVRERQGVQKSGSRGFFSDSSLRHSFENSPMESKKCIRRRKDNLVCKTDVIGTEFSREQLQFRSGEQPGKEPCDLKFLHISRKKLPSDRQEIPLNDNRRLQTELREGFEDGQCLQSHSTRQTTSESLNKGCSVQQDTAKVKQKGRLIKKGKEQALTNSERLVSYTYTSDESVESLTKNTLRTRQKADKSQHSAKPMGNCSSGGKAHSQRNLAVALLDQINDSVVEYIASANIAESDELRANDVKAQNKGTSKRTPVAVRNLSIPKARGRKSVLKAKNRQNMRRKLNIYKETLNGNCHEQTKLKENPPETKNRKNKERLVSSATIINASRNVQTNKRNTETRLTFSSKGGVQNFESLKDNPLQETYSVQVKQDSAQAEGTEIKLVIKRHVLPNFKTETNAEHRANPLEQQNGHPDAEKPESKSSKHEPLYLSSTPQTEELSDGPPLLTRISPITDVRSLYSDKDDEDYDTSPPPLPLPVLILSPTSAESQDQYGSAPILRREITSTPTDFNTNKIDHDSGLGEHSAHTIEQIDLRPQSSANVFLCSNVPNTDNTDVKTTPREQVEKMADSGSHSMPLHKTKGKENDHATSFCQGNSQVHLNEESSDLRQRFEEHSRTNSKIQPHPKPTAHLLSSSSPLHGNDLVDNNLQTVRKPEVLLTLGKPQHKCLTEVDQNIQISPKKRSTFEAPCNSSRKETLQQLSDRNGDAPTLLCDNDPITVSGVKPADPSLESGRQDKQPCRAPSRSTSPRKPQIIQSHIDRNVRKDNPDKTPKSNMGSKRLLESNCDLQPTPSDHPVFYQFYGEASSEDSGDDAPRRLVIRESCSDLDIDSGESENETIPTFNSQPALFNSNILFLW